MGAWIEITPLGKYKTLLFVAPVWGRGLKCRPSRRFRRTCSRPRMGAWIEIGFLAIMNASDTSPPYGGVD